MLFYLITYSIIIFGYYLIAKHFHLYDKPNIRSSHKLKTLNSGGIIFPIALITPIIYELEINLFIYLVVGTIIISIISFIDDIKPVSNSIRVFAQTFSVILILIFFEIQTLSIGYFIISFILIVGILNAYNFMDGINGLNVMYSLTTLSSIYFLNITYNLIPSLIIESLIISLIIFLFLNFRNNAIFFSGDVGSVSIGYIISFLILALIIKDQSIKWILLLGVYGLDSVGTIVLRIIRNENIFIAHRTHLYQFLTNEKYISHLTVSLIYSLVQLMLNIILILKSNLFIAITYIILIFTYVIIRINYEGYNKLFKNNI